MSRSLFAVARPSVCRLCVCLSVTLVHPTQAVVNLGNFSTAFGALAICWHAQKILWRSSQGNLSIVGVKPKRGSEIEQFWTYRRLHLGTTTTTTTILQCKIRGKLLLITNRKLYLSFRLVPKSVTLNDPEWRSGHYFRYFSKISSIQGTLSKSGWRYSQNFCDRNVVQASSF